MLRPDAPVLAGLACRGINVGGRGGQPWLEARPASAKLEEQRRAVVRACRDLEDQRLVVGTAADVSVRVDDLVVISSSGVDYAAMTAEDVGAHDLSGAPVPVLDDAEVVLVAQRLRGYGRGGRDPPGCLSAA